MREVRKSQEKKSQVLMSCVGEKEQISKREKEEDHTVVKGRVEYQQKSNKKVKKQYFIYINFFYFFLLLLKTDFSVQEN